MKSILFVAISLLLSLPLFSQNIKPKEQNGKWGYINADYNWVFKPQYEQASKFYDGLAKVKKNGKWGYIDINNNTVIPFAYDAAGNFSEKLAWVSKGLKRFYINDKGVKVFDITEFADYGYRFSEGLAEVKKDDKWGYIDNNGNIVIDFKFTKSSPFNRGVAKVIETDGNEKYIDHKGEETYTYSLFAKKYVEDSINTWQRRGKFERIEDYESRINDSTRKAKIEKLTTESQEIFIKQQLAKAPYNFNLNGYDNDREFFKIADTNYGNVRLNVPIDKAPEFESTWNDIKIDPKFCINDDQVAIYSVSFMLPDSTQYSYVNEKALFADENSNMDYDFETIKTNRNLETSGLMGSAPILDTTTEVVQSDVDVDIPVNLERHNDTFAVIIANENYRKEASVEYAKNDGVTFREYCIKTLGIPESNVHTVLDATLNDMRYEIKWISTVAKQHNGTANIIFYYSGHGVPDEQTHSAFLLPIDGYSTDAETGYRLNELYSRFADSNPQSSLVLLDACFSGAQRNGEIMAAARGTAIKAKPDSPVGNMVVFSAAQGNETAYPYKEKYHGMFTYYLLKKLQETEGSASLGEISDYVIDNVSKRSIIANSKAQTPSLVPSQNINEGWRDNNVSKLNFK